MTTVSGYDLSSSQGTITTANWQAMKAAGCQFVIVECGIGNDGMSSSYTTFCEGAASVSIGAIPYHFVYAGLPTNPLHPNRDPISQAKLHASYCANKPAFIDLEYLTQQDFATFGVPAGATGVQQVCDWIEQYLTTYKSLCGYCGVYTYPDYASADQMNFAVNLPSLADYPLWVASYQSGSPTIPAPWTDWIVWQDSGNGGGTLPNGAVVDCDQAKDMSVFNPFLGVSPVVPVAPTPAVPVVVPTPSVPVPAPTPAPTPVVASGGFWSNFLQAITKLFGSK